MSDFTQQPFINTQPFDFGSEFADNPEPRCPCVLLLDVSGSMTGAPIDELNAGLVAFKDELMADELAAKRVEVALITFGPVRVRNPFETADVFQPEQLDIDGDTPMGAAIIEALHLIEDRKKAYQGAGVSYYRPWIFLITDGEPTDEWHHAAALVREGVEKRKLAFFAVGIQGADMTTLAAISPRKPLALKGLRFRELFQWLSNSLGTVSRSSPAQEILRLPPPGNDWAEL